MGRPLKDLNEYNPEYLVYEEKGCPICRYRNLAYDPQTHVLECPYCTNTAKGKDYDDAYEHLRVVAPFIMFHRDLKALSKSMEIITFDMNRFMESLRSVIEFQKKTSGGGVLN